LSSGIGPSGQPSRSPRRGSIDRIVSPRIDNEYYSEDVHGPHEYFELGDFTLEMGETLLGARLAYKNLF
jgi:hypothetical protein